MTLHILQVVKMNKYSIALLILMSTNVYCVEDDNPYKNKLNDGNDITITEYYNGNQTYYEQKDVVNRYSIRVTGGLFDVEEVIKDNTRYWILYNQQDKNTIIEIVANHSSTEVDIQNQLNEYLLNKLGK